MSGGGCAGRKKGRGRKALTCGPGSPEREGRLARGAALSAGEGGRARLAGPACQRDGVRALGCGVSERAGPFARERKRSSWARVEAFWAGQGNDEEAGWGC